MQESTVNRATTNRWIWSWTKVLNDKAENISRLDDWLVLEQ